MFQRILVVIDGSESSLQAADVAIEVATVLQAKLDILSIEETSPGNMPTHQESIASHLETLDYFNHLQTSVRLRAERVGIQTRSAVLSGSEGQVILDYSKEQHCDLILLGATGHEHFWPPTPSRTAHKVANEATCSVMLVPPSALRLPVRHIMATEVVRVTPRTPLAEVVSHLIEGSVKLLPVVNNEQRVLGVITLGYLLSHNDAFRRLDLQQITSTQHMGQYVRGLFTGEKTARDVMNRHPLVVKDEDMIEAAAQKMISQHITRAPVVNAKGKLVGMLDQANLLHYYTDLPRNPQAIPTGESVQLVGHPQTVGGIPLSQVPILALGTPLTEVLQQVQETPLRRVIVVDSEGKAMGVIADSDILASRGLATRHNPIMALAGRLSLVIPEELFRRRSSTGPLIAREVMRPRLYAVTPATPVAEAIRLMLAHQIKRLVVVDESGKPLGLVERQPLLRSFIEGGEVSG
jgi:CBS domain-containing protein